MLARLQTVAAGLTAGGWATTVMLTVTGLTKPTPPLLVVLTGTVTLGLNQWAAAPLGSQHQGSAWQSSLTDTAEIARIYDLGKVVGRRGW